MSDKIYIGNQKFRLPRGRVHGKLVVIDGIEYYAIENYDRMDPFLMSIVSNSDHWMYISSTGGLTAGRKNPDNAIFPYYTEDKIHESYLTTGSKTIILSASNDKKLLWEPFSDFYRGVYDIKCKLYKNITGNRVIFEEINNDLELTYRYSWMNSEQYGWIKKNSIINNSGKSVHISVLDGVRNILPYGVTQQMQNDMSTLVDAYKKNELEQFTGLGIFRLASIPVDRAVPSEALKCTTAWFTGYKPLSVLMSHRQLKQFKQGGITRSEEGSKGVRGCYFTVGDFELKPHETKHTYFVIEPEQDSADVEKLIYLLEENDDLAGSLERDVALGTEKLNYLVSIADGIQHTADKMSCVRHFSNVLFNSMRGGVFEKAYEVKREHFERHVEKFNKKIYQEQKGWLADLPESMALDFLVEKVKKKGNRDLLRLTFEYLPLSFSRRHGDPSRPWNRFEIKLKEDDDKLSYSYQGNWRDIFQNWEALALSYPGFLPSMISRFLNSSTVDGYNPYRISSDGIDWEVPDPDDPWAHIGYWGDHQTIYLLRLLELAYEFKPRQLNEWMDLQIFSYANVPYRIKEYHEIIRNPYDTIDFDAGENSKIGELSTTVGADGRMVLDSEGNVLKASFTEKILVSLLTKITNFIPGAGIWMNTQRPEWNDANNALVGNGASMVSLYYMRRMIHFLEELYGGAGEETYKIRHEVVELFTSVYNTLLEWKNVLVASFDDNFRKDITDKLGKAGSTYRVKVYKGFAGSFNSVHGDRLIEFLDLVSEYIDLSIKDNRRVDGLYNAYNLINVRVSSIEVLPLQEMLEGQVAVLSSNVLKPLEAAQLIEKMYDSELFRPDQNSFMLYPDKELKSFRSNNNINEKDISKSRLLKKLLNDGDNSIIQKDIRGDYHFNGSFKSAEDLNNVLDRLEDKYGGMVEEERDLICNIFESVFQHKYFTGRSGSFYKYEGLGSIYWHMVSKMLLAAGEYVRRAYKEDCDEKTRRKLVALYYRLKSGIGIDKEPYDYGAFPFDPYSHTPSMMGVQQPGMTGQVKEDIISRYIELGIQIENGCLHFKPSLLRRNEFIRDKKGNEFLDFTFCSTPVKYCIGQEAMVKISFADSDDKIIKDQLLSYELSESVFKRDGIVRSIEVNISEDQLF
ncbi:MAG: hypothetical protein U9N72_07785 [Bacteroidota bacterium]|nr:hypothetical protein [Bacteroidota bacterium]